ncbi:MAG: hypothetical protein WAW42_08740 [Candidatus Competibacteraceae bacterium]
MQFYTLQQALADLGQVIANTLSNQEETAIIGESGTVILIPQQEFESIRETLRLLSDRRSLNALLAGHAERDAGHLPVNVQSKDQVFYDKSSTFE